MVRATRRTTHPYQHVPAHGRRGVAGYRGVAADALEDPPIVYSPRVLVVPDVEDAPVTAGGEEIEVGGVQTVRLLGPFHVAHDTAGFVSSNGIAVLDVPANVLVLRTFMIITEDWDDPAGGILLGIGTAAEVGTNSWKTITDYTTDMYTSGLAYFHEHPPTVPPMVGLPGPTGGHIFAQGTGTFLTGESDIYAVIAEPAA